MSNQNYNQQPLSETLKHPIATATATIDRHREGTSTRGATNTSTTFGINYHGTPQQNNPVEYNPNFQGNNSGQQGGAMMRDDYNQQQPQQQQQQPPMHHQQGGGQLVGQQGTSGQPQQQQQQYGGGGYSDGQQHQAYGGDQRQPMNVGGQAYNDQRQPMHGGGGVGRDGGQAHGGQQQRFNEPSGGYGGQDSNRSGGTNERSGHQQDPQRPGYDAQRGYDHNQESHSGSGLSGLGRAGGQTGPQGIASTGAGADRMTQPGNRHQRHPSGVDQNQMGRSYDNGVENQKYANPDFSTNQFTRQGAAGSGTGASSDTSSGSGSHRVSVGATPNTHHNPSSTGVSSTSPTNASKPGFGEKLRGATKEFMGKIDGDKERVVEGQQLQQGTHPTQQARR